MKLSSTKDLRNGLINVIMKLSSTKI